MTWTCSAIMAFYLATRAPKPGETVVIHASKAKAMGCKETDIPEGMRHCQKRRIHCKIDWTR